MWPQKLLLLWLVEAKSMAVPIWGQRELGKHGQSWESMEKASPTKHLTRTMKGCHGLPAKWQPDFKDFRMIGFFMVVKHCNIGK